MTEAGRTPSRAAVRPEIQALRALAVSLVVVYHFWPQLLSGGYIGVDVFFAISGFLITSHLIREVTRTGGVSIPGFYARRARRILPAALLILFLVTVATLVFVPHERWAQFLNEERASTFYVQNWYLAHAAVDYLAATNTASPVQHFWSLSVEEQFYLVWPFVLLLGVLLTRAGPLAERRRTVVTVLLGGLVGASLVYSIVKTSDDPAVAFFVTPTRVWEFGAGGLLALLATSTARPALRSVVSIAGLAAIMVSAVTYTDGTAFPGYAALLPILGTIAVIWAGAPAARFAPTKVMELRPIAFLGNISYSVYLWHWPLLILTPFVLGIAAVGDAGRVVLLVLAILAAWATKVVVEDPFRTRRPFLAGRRPRYTFAGVLAGTAVVLALTLYGTADLDAVLKQDRQQTQQVLAHKPRCFGAASMDPRHPCVNPKLRFSVVPAVPEAEQTGNPTCPTVDPDKLRPICAIYVPKGKPAGTFAVIGDSHAGHWRAALLSMARRLHLHGYSITRSLCPLSSMPPDQGPERQAPCVAWRPAVDKWLAAHPAVDTIFVAAHAANRVDIPDGSDQLKANVEGYKQAWSRVPPSVKHIIVLRDDPGAQELTCVTRAQARDADPAKACALKRKTALVPDPQAVAARQLDSPRVKVIDMTPFFCTKTECPPVIGGALVYKDIHHITKVYSATLGPYLTRYYQALSRRWTR